MSAKSVTCLYTICICMCRCGRVHHPDRFGVCSMWKAIWLWVTMLGINDNCDILVWDLGGKRRLYYRQSRRSSPSPIPVNLADTSRSVCLCMGVRLLHARVRVNTDGADGPHVRTWARTCGTESNILLPLSLCPSDPAGPHPVMICFYLSYTPQPRETSANITTCTICLHTTEPEGAAWIPTKAEMKWIFISDKTGVARHQAGIITESDLNRGGYCFIASQDDSMPSGLKEENMEIWVRIACSHIPLLLSNLLVKDKTPLAQMHLALLRVVVCWLFSQPSLSSTHPPKDLTVAEQPFEIVPAISSFRGNCPWLLWVRTE